MDYRIEAPALIRDFLTYHETIQGHSKKTVDEYFLDLRTFFRFMKLEKGLVPRTAEFEEIPIGDVDIALAGSVTLTDVYSFMNYLRRDRSRGAPARARKIATIRSFYKYLTNKAKLLTENPVQDLDSPRTKKNAAALSGFGPEPGAAVQRGRGQPGARLLHPDPVPELRAAYFRVSGA